jgi:hypothetical protein
MITTIIGPGDDNYGQGYDSEQDSPQPKKWYNKIKKWRKKK